MRNFTRIRIARRPLAVNIDWPHQVFHPSHGPQSWRWWHLFSIRAVRVSVHPPSSGFNIWFYSRWGALILGLYFDRRTPEQLGESAA